jgi:hypothetical protein
MNLAWAYHIPNARACAVSLSPRFERVSAIVKTKPPAKKTIGAPTADAKLQSCQEFVQISAKRDERKPKDAG